MARLFTSVSVETTLSATISSSATNITVANAAALLGDITIGASDQFTVALDPDTASEEIVFVTAANTSTNTLTVTRGRAGTSAITHASGAQVKHVLTSSDLTAFETGVNNAITTSSTSTLTNKTIALGSNTVSGTTAQFNTALTDGDFTTLAGTETLTNKNLTSSSNTFPSTLVTTTGTQTLSSKDLTATSNTFPSTLVTTTGTQTLTNKTIDGNSNTLTNLPAAVTLLSTTTISSGSSTVTVSSISGSYRNLMIDIEAVTAGNGVVYLWLNSSNSGSSAQCVFTSAAGSGVASSAADGDRIVLAPTGPQTTGGETNKWVINIYNYTTSQSFTYSGRLGKTTNHVGIFGGGAGKGASYSAITLEVIGTTFSSGTIKIYGIN